MPASVRRRVRNRYLPLLFATALMGCSSSPSHLYLLNSEPPSPQLRTVATAQAGHDDLRYGSSSPPSQQGRNHGAGNPLLLGVAVNVPEYLDRLEIVERSGTNEVTPKYDAQWAENLSVNATRTLVEDLSARLPSDDVIMLPSRSHQSIDYEVTLDLRKFESDAAGNSVMAGRWSIADSHGIERASGHVMRTEPAGQPGYEAMAAAMSRNLGAVSDEVTAAVQKLPSSSRS